MSFICSTRPRARCSEGVQSVNDNSLRVALLSDQAITAQLDTIVRRATQTVLKLEGNRDMEVGQLRNLLSTATETPQLAVIDNYIRYQIARNGRAWGTDPQSFGHQVIADLRWVVGELAPQLVERLQKGTGIEGEALAVLRQQVAKRLMLLYIGYLNRSFFVARRLESFGALKEALKSSELPKEATNG